MTATADERPAGTALSVDAELTLDVDDDRVDVWSENDGGVVVVNAPSVSAARSMLEGAEALPFDTDWTGIGLEAMGITVEFRVRHATVARAGALARPRLASYIANLPEIEIVPAGVVLGVARALF